jgi:hypothetical protein
VAFQLNRDLSSCVKHYKGGLLLKVNCYGKRIKQLDVVADNTFLNDKGQVNWNLLINADEHGFDLNGCMENGKHIMPDYILPKGMRIIRYGGNQGNFTAPLGTPYEKLSLPFLQESRVYHEYVVNKSCKVVCVVTKGYVAKGFSSEGGAIQFFHARKIYELQREKVLKEDFRWIIKALLKL